MPTTDSPVDIVQLRRAAERCLSLLGTGVIEEPANAALRARLFDGATDLAHFGRQLQIRLLQMIAWCLAERLGGVPSRNASSASTDEYERHYSFRRLRRGRQTSSRNDSQGASRKLQRALHGLWQGDSAIAVSSLHSELFDPANVPELVEAELSDTHAYRLLTAIQDEIVDLGSGTAPEHPDVQILGHVHEWFLQLRLFLNRKDDTLSFETSPGHLRRATGSYFTPRDLVENLVDLVVQPQLDDRIANAGTEGALPAILSLRVVDPACGTGVFLLAAAKRIASVLARYWDSSAHGNETALCAVIKRCIHGVDIGPTTVHLCRLALWFEAGAPFDVLPELDAHILCGNSVFGFWPDSSASGIPDIAFTPGPADDPRQAKALKRRNRQERSQHPTGTLASLDPFLAADLWCSAFIWPKVVGESAPTHAVLFDPAKRAGSREREVRLRYLATENRFFHWFLRFADVFSSVEDESHPECQRQPGFDIVIGNPPWVAHAGRSTQSLPHGLRNFLIHTYASFSGYPTTHGVFVEMATRLLAMGGRLGLIVPASVADLEGYAATRAAHDERCALLRPLPDYGEGRFTGVTQPCVALVSRRTSDARPADERGRPWPIERTDLDSTGSALLDGFARARSFPAEMFGERGFQSTPELRQHVRRASGPEGCFTLPLREGADIREFQLGAAHLYADPLALKGVLRPMSEFAEVALIVRQTARYPIAARNDGLAFRNSLLAVLHHDDWHWPLMLCLLNSSFFRWLHFHRYRDGRQPILPQLKVGHLRSLPAPIRRDANALRVIENLGLELAGNNRGIQDGQRTVLDECVAAVYELSAEQYALITAWHSSRPR